MIFIKRIHLFFLFHQRKYEAVLKRTAININSSDLSKLDPVKLRYQALCSFYNKNYYHSKMCLELLQEKGIIKAKEYNLLAYIFARHNDKERAMSAWCRALEVDKSNKAARKILEYIKSKGREINLSEDVYFDRFIAKQPFLIPVKFLTRLVLVLVLLSGVGFAAYSGYKSDFLKKMVSSSKKRKDAKKINSMKLPDYNPNILMEQKSDKRYSYSEKEVKKLFEESKNSVLEDRPVDAQIMINRIKMSNASGEVKMRVTMLENYINEPDYAIFKNRIDYRKVAEEPLLFDNIYIKWPGRVVNRQVYKDRLTFDFIIGNEEEGVVEAIIPVVFKKAVIVDNNDKLTLFGVLHTKGEQLEISGKFVIKDR